MEENQIVRMGDEKWQLIEKMKSTAKSESNNLMYLLAEHIEKYGASREDILEYLAGHPFPSINSIAIINEVKGLVQKNISVQWMEAVQDILRFREDKATLYIDELKRAVSVGLPYEIFREGMEKEETPYKIHLFLDEKIDGFADKMEEKEKKRMLQLDYLVDRLNEYHLKTEALLGKMEDVLNKQENALIKSSTFSGQTVKQSTDLQESNIIETGIEEQEEPEEMYFDESFLPVMEFEETDNSGEDNPEDNQEGDDSEEVYFDESSVPALEYENTDSISDIGIDQKSSMIEDSEFIMEEVFHYKEESPRRYKRMMAAAVRMFAMEKQRFLKQTSDEQREFLIKKLLEKKAKISKVNVLKELFDHFSNEYLYNLVVRDATEAELKNLLLLSK